MTQQSHRALAIKPADTVVFTAMSKIFLHEIVRHEICARARRCANQSIYQF